MAFELPNSLGPFSVDAQGRIAPRDGAEMPNFLFRWRDRKVTARLMGRDGDGSLTISAWLGRMPSSAAQPVSASPTNDRRRTSFASLRCFLDMLPGDWRVRLLPDHQVRLEAELLLAWPATAVDLLTQLTRFLLALAPYLDLLDEEDVLELSPPGPADPEPVAAGMLNT
jgi:hypothetical protein